MGITTYKFYKQEITWLTDKTSTCFICNRPLFVRYGIRGYSSIRGYSPNGSIFLRDKRTNDALSICDSDICFNMILLNAENHSVFREN